MVFISVVSTVKEPVDRTGEAGLRGPASPMGPEPASDPGPGRDSTRDPLNTHKGPTEHTHGTN